MLLTSKWFVWAVSFVVGASVVVMRIIFDVFGQKIRGRNLTYFEDFILLVFAFVMASALWVGLSIYSPESRVGIGISGVVGFLSTQVGLLLLSRGDR